jgi:hypothetical protein
MNAVARGVAAGVLALVLAGAALAQVQDPADPGARIPRPAAPNEPPALAPQVDAAQRFTALERERFQSWAVAEYGKGRCPPGLVKRETRCLPRGQTRKRYRIGEPLPPGTVPAPVPLDLARRIGVPPIGYRYGMIDGDLVKIEVASGRAVDALDGFIPK